MNTGTDPTPHRTLLQELISKCEGELPFYERGSNFHYVAWHIAATVSLLASLSSSAIAALVDKDTFSGAAHTALVVLPLIGAAAAACMRLYKFREKEALREDGRIELQSIIGNAKSLLASARDDAVYRTHYHAVLARFDMLERDQHRRDIALRDDERPHKPDAGTA